MGLIQFSSGRERGENRQLYEVKLFWPVCESDDSWWDLLRVFFSSQFGAKIYRNEPAAKTLSSARTAGTRWRAMVKQFPLILSI